MISLFVFSFCLLFSSPIFSFEHEKSVEEFLNFIESIDSDDDRLDDELEQQFDALAESIDDSEDPLVEARAFLQEFLKELQQRYGVSLTIPQACELAKQNLDMFELSDEEREEFLISLDFLAEEI